MLLTIFLIFCSDDPHAQETGANLSQILEKAIRRVELWTHGSQKHSTVIQFPAWKLQLPGNSGKEIQKIKEMQLT